MNSIKSIEMPILEKKPGSTFTSVLLFGDTTFDNDKNSFILEVT